MATTKEAFAATGTVYSLEGTLLEACSCGILCPCWVGEDPDLGECFAFNAYKFERGVIDGVDVSGLSIALVVHIPGNILTPGSWRVVLVVDERASQQQHDAIVAAYTGKLGGPLADLAGLVGEVLGIERAPISHRIDGGAGTLSIPGMIEASMEPYRGPDGTITTLRDSLFSTVPGSPAWAGKASLNKVTLAKYGLEWTYEGRNAIQSEYRMEFSR